MSVNPQQATSLPNGIPPQMQQQINSSLSSQQPTGPQIMSKFMPPSSQYAPQSINNNPVAMSTTTSSQMHQQQYQQQQYQQQQQQQSQNSHFPPMRLNPSLTNGGGGSGQSSRTASPAANSSFNPPPMKASPSSNYAFQGNQNKMPFPNAAAPVNQPISGGHHQQQQQQQQHMSNISKSMQNLSLHAASPNSPLPPPPSNSASQMQKSAVQNYGSNYPMNFPTSASNSSSVPPVSTAQNQAYGNQQAARVTNQMQIQPPHMLPPISMNGPHSNAPPGTDPPRGSTVSGSYTSKTLSAPNIHTVPPLQNINQNNFPYSNPQLHNQHTVNNNPAQSAPFVPQMQQSQQHMPNARKPMYPVAKPQQPEQPYSQAYQSQNQQRPSFNGQTNTAPLQYQQQSTLQANYNQMSVTQQGFNRLWGQDTLDLMQHRHILPHEKVKPPRILLNNQFHESVNCNADIMRCTLTKIPESNNLLQKSRLPLGIVVHPFRDINSLPVIQCPNIVRCRLCRTYINPFVYFVDSKMWKCNLCYRVNELPEDFQYDPATKTYGDVTRRPEVRSSTIEFIAPSEYMLRPPQPAIYLFLFDVSILAQQSGYLEAACSVVAKHLDDMPGDARTQVGFIAYNSEIHFYNIAEGYNQPHEMTLVDIEDPFLPCPDNLLVNRNECKDLIKDLLTQLPSRFADTHDPGSALGAALQVAYKLMSASGGRVAVFQTCLPNKGPGALQPREDPNNRSAKEVLHLNPATDFYKKHALECSGNQIAVDLFLLNQQYSDLATICGVSKYSGGSIHHFPLYQKTKPQHVDAFKQCLKRYLTRKIGFEAVMRIRCTRGLQVHTFHGNFFVRSTDLLSLPNVNPDAAYGMQISYEESLTDIKTICFQAALLYTNSEGERRIRVHTLCLPVTSNLSEIMHSADSQSIISLLGKMAVDRSLTSNVADAREAFINATIDILSAFRIAQNLPQGQTGQLIAPRNLALLPLYISALLKHLAFRTGTSTRLDDRVAAMDAMKTLPLDQLMKFIYPEFYIIDCLFYNLENSNETEEDDPQPEPPLLQLSAEHLDSRSIFLMDCGTLIIVYVGLNVPPSILESLLGVHSTADIPDYCFGLPTLNTPENEALKNFINNLNDDKPYLPTIQIIRDTSTCKQTFMEKLVDDRSESSLSYYEFLQHLRSQVK